MLLEIISALRGLGFRRFVVVDDGSTGPSQDVLSQLAGVLAATRLLESLLFGISARDPWTFSAVAAILTGVALLASYLPARRAASADPMEAPRAESDRRAPSAP